MRGTIWPSIFENDLLFGLTAPCQILLTSFHPSICQSTFVSHRDQGNHPHQNLPIQATLRRLTIILKLYFYSLSKFKKLSTFIGFFFFIKQSCFSSFWSTPKKCIIIILNKSILFKICWLFFTVNSEGVFYFDWQRGVVTKNWHHIQKVLKRHTVVTGRWKDPHNAVFERVNLYRK